MENPTFLYHRKHGAKVFDSSEVKALEAEGWRDNPDDAEKVRARAKTNGAKPEPDKAETNADDVGNAAPAANAAAEVSETA